MSDEAKDTTAVETEPAEKLEPNSDEALAKFVHDKVALATTDSEEGDEPEAEGDEPAEEGAKPKESDTEKATEPEPFTAEQLADPAFFDKLDKSGWERLEKLNPGLYAMGKSVASARGKAWAEYQKLQKESEKAEPKSEEAPKRSWSPELKAAWQRKQSLDEDEAFEGEVEFQRLLNEQTQSPDDIAQNVLKAAYREAAKSMPQLNDLDAAELDAVVDADEDLTADCELAMRLKGEERVALIASVMRKAGKVALAARASTAQRKAADEAKAADDKKKADSQKRLKSNENNASKTITESPTGAKTRPKDFSDESLAARIKEQMTQAARKTA